MLWKVRESAAFNGIKNEEVQEIDKLSSIAIPSSDIAGEIRDVMVGGNLV